MHIKSERGFRNKETGHVITFLELGGRKPTGDDPVVKIMEDPDGMILDAVVMKSKDAADKITSLHGKEQFEDASAPTSEPPAGRAPDPLQRADEPSKPKPKKPKKGGDDVT